MTLPILNYATPKRPPTWPEWLDAQDGPEAVLCYGYSMLLLLSHLVVHDVEGWRVATAILLFVVAQVLERPDRWKNWLGNFY